MNILNIVSTSNYIYFSISNAPTLEIFLSRFLDNTILYQIKK